MIHKADRHLRRLVSKNVIYNDAGVHLKPKYFPNLQTFIVGTTCNNMYKPYPRFYESSHGRLVKKLLSRPTLRELNIRTIENYTHPSFWQAVVFTIKGNARDAQQSKKDDKNEDYIGILGFSR